MSNILKIFQQGQSSESKPQNDEECLGCLATAGGVMTLGGLYLASGYVFQNGGKPLPNVSSSYKSVVRVSGAAVFVFGLYRSYEAYAFYKAHGWGGFQ